MNKTKIDWATHSLNPVKGRCPNPDCVLGERCYAREMYKRFQWNPEVRFEPEVMESCHVLPPGSRIFVGSTMELFGPWVKTEWMQSIFGVARLCPDVNFLFLTKRPLDLLRYSPYSSNTWVGATVCNQSMLEEAIVGLAGIKARVKYLSFEPLMGEIRFSSAYDLTGIDLVIIGGWSRYSAKTAPKVQWIEGIVKEADTIGAEVFLKDNLLRVFGFEIPTWLLEMSDSIVSARSFQKGR